MISLETNDNYYNFGLWLEPAKLVSERLKVLINGNNTLQGLYDVIRSMTMEKVQNKNKVPTSHVFTTTTLSTTLTPVTVHSQQQQQSTAGTPPSLSDVAGDSDGNISGDDEQSISRGSPAKGALTAAYKASLAKSSSTPTARVSTPETTTSNSSQPSASNNWPVYLQKPKGPVKCGCTDHLEKKQSDIVLPINPKQLFDILFSSEKDSIWHQLNKTKGYGGNHSMCKYIKLQ
jgi:hypothetical protein